MKLYISTHTATDGFSQWYGEAPNSELKSLMNTLPAKDRKNSLAIERTGRGTCRLALKRLIAQDDCLIIDQLEEHEARCLARAYLLKREEMRAGIAACIHGQGSAAEADMPQLERALRACMELVPVQTDAPPKYQKLILPITPDATQETAERLRSHRLINGAGLRVIISDFYSVEDLKDEDIDAALCGTCPVGASSGANGGSKLLWFALGAALLVGAIVYLSSGSSEPTDPKDSPVQLPRPTAAQEGKQGVDEHVESKNTELIHESI